MKPRQETVPGLCMYSMTGTASARADYGIDCGDVDNIGYTAAS